MVRDGESCEIEPRLEYVAFAIRAEIRSVSEGSKGYDRENSRVSRSARPEDFLSSGCRLLSRDAREFFSKRRTSFPTLTHRSINATQTHGRLDARLCRIGILTRLVARTFVQLVERRSEGGAR
jgi:hypothetical protein